MVTREFPPRSGGLGYYVYYLSKRLLQRRHQVTVITRGSTRGTRKEIINGIEVFKASFFPSYPLHVWLHGVFVNAVIKSLEPRLTLIHLHTPVTPVIKTSLPIITTVHSPMKIDSRYHQVVDIPSLAERVHSTVFTPRLESKLFRASNIVTAVSQTVTKELRDYGLNPDEIAVVRNGVDEKTFVPIQNKKKECYVLYTGVLWGRKGLFDLMSCAEQVCKERMDIKFVLCGRGPLLNRLMKEVHTRGLQQQVIFLGYVERKRLVETFQNATIHVVPSHYEGLPTVLLEAMSCGLPVVATDIGGNNEVISPGVNGFLVPPKHPELMAKIILRLLDDTALRERIGRAARKTIEEYYTWDKITDKIVRCYESIL